MFCSGGRAGSAAGHSPRCLALLANAMLAASSPLPARTRLKLECNVQFLLLRLFQVLDLSALCAGSRGSCTPNGYWALLGVGFPSAVDSILYDFCASHCQRKVGI